MRSMGVWAICAKLDAVKTLVGQTPLWSLRLPPTATVRNVLANVLWDRLLPPLPFLSLVQTDVPHDSSSCQGRSL